MTQRPRSSSGVRSGPERFFYDKSTHTGVHTHGGPSTIDKGGISKFSDLSEMTRQNLRGARSGSTRMSIAGAGNVRQAALSPAPDQLARSGSAVRRPSASTAAGDQALRGPERFFYDKSTYTGVHTSVSPRPRETGCGNGSSQLRAESRVPMKVVVLKTRRPSSATTYTAKVATPARTGQLRGPERFFYDKSSYTGVHNHGGPSTLDRHNVSDLREITRPNLG